MQKIENRSRLMRTFTLSSLETLGTQLFVFLHYMMLATLMTDVHFGKLSALYALTYLGSGVGGSGITNTLTLIKSYTTVQGTTLIRTLVRQWLISVPLALLTVLTSRLWSLKNPPYHPVVLLGACMVACLGILLKKQLNHTIRLWGSHTYTVITELFYHAVYVVILAAYYLLYGSFNVFGIFAFFTAWIWLFVGVYIWLFRSVVQHTDQPAGEDHALVKNNHMLYALSDLTKIGFSPNSVVLVSSVIFGPEKAGFIKLLHASGRVIFTSLGKMLDTVLHISYAQQTCPDTRSQLIHRITRYIIPVLCIGSIVTLTLAYKSTFLRKYILQEPIATIALIMLFATTYIENILRFNLLRLGKAGKSCFIAVTLLMVLLGGIVCLQSCPTLVQMSIMLVLVRMVGIGWMYYEGIKAPEYFFDK